MKISTLLLVMSCLVICLADKRFHREKILARLRGSTESSIESAESSTNNAFTFTFSDSPTKKELQEARSISGFSKKQTQREQILERIRGKQKNLPTVTTTRRTTTITLPITTTTSTTTPLTTTTKFKQESIKPIYERNRTFNIPVNDVTTENVGSGSQEEITTSEPLTTTTTTTARTTTPRITTTTRPATTNAGKTIRTFAPRVTEKTVATTLATTTASNQSIVDKLIPTKSSRHPTRNYNKPRYLTLPTLEKCKNRPKEFNFKGRNYFYSDHQEELKDLQVDWLESRNICREYCMDSVSMETEEENNVIIEFVKKHNITFLWTSGRTCDFSGCEGRADLLPKLINGWLWTNNQEKIAATNKIPPGFSYQPWGKNGSRKKPQPDDAEWHLNGTHESCLAIFNNIFDDGVSWHDSGCYHEKPFICEDSDQLLEEFGLK